MTTNRPPTSPEAAQVEIVEGQVIVQRLLDVADTIDLGLAESLWLSYAGHEGRRTHLATASEKEVTFEVPPMLIELPTRSIDVDGMPQPARMTARLYDFGAVALALSLDASGLSWNAFVARRAAVEKGAGAGATTAMWREALSTVLAVIGPALRRPAAQHLEEDYLYAVVHRFAEPMTGDDVRTRVDLAPLLSAEPRPLSRQETEELTRQSFSYLLDDLVVLTWNCAFVYEPRRDSDVIDIIEFANAQLLEMRYYDDLLDDELSTMYTLIEGAQGGLTLVASRRAARLARRLHGLVAEVTRLTERVENSLQVTEDVYLARIYSACLELFRVPKLSSAVGKKLAIIRDTYSVMYEEASSRRAEMLELAIVLLIVVELMLALWK